MGSYHVANIVIGPVKGNLTSRLPACEAVGTDLEAVVDVEVTLTEKKAHKRALAPRSQQAKSASVNSLSSTSGQRTYDLRPVEPACPGTGAACSSVSRAPRTGRCRGDPRLRLAVRGDQDIRRLEVEKQNAFEVCGLERPANLQGEPQRVRVRERARNGTPLTRSRPRLGLRSRDRDEIDRQIREHEVE